MFFSIIIPVYNTSEFLKVCLDSVINQNFNDYEIVIVNDGSTDKSGQIIADYSVEYPDLIVSLYQDNQGLSSARNSGISEARGRFLCFVDSDDWINLDFLSTVYETLSPYASKVKAIVICNRDFVYNDKIVDDNLISFKPTSIHDSPELISKLNLSACNKVYHKSLFDDNFFPVGKLYEDVIPVLKATLHSDLVLKVDNVLYHVRKDNPNSITSNINQREYDLPCNLEVIDSYILKYHKEFYKYFKVVYSNTLAFYITRVVKAGRYDFLSYVDFKKISLTKIDGFLPCLAVLMARFNFNRALRLLLKLRDTLKLRKK